MTRAEFSYTRNHGLCGVWCVSYGFSYGFTRHIRSSHGHAMMYRNMWGGESEKKRGGMERAEIGVPCVCTRCTDRSTVNGVRVGRSIAHICTVKGQSSYMHMYNQLASHRHRVGWVSAAGLGSYMSTWRLAWGVRCDGLGFQCPCV